MQQSHWKSRHLKSKHSQRVGILKYPSGMVIIVNGGISRGNTFVACVLITSLEHLTWSLKEKEEKKKKRNTTIMRKIMRLKVKKSRFPLRGV